MSKVHQKLLQVQIALKAPKSNYNSFGKYSYRSCEDIMEAAKPLLKDQGLTMLISDDVFQIGDRYYIRATVTVMDAESGELVQASALAREEETKKGMDASQITGAASSYARKYALNGMFAIDDTKDADTRPPSVPKKSTVHNAARKSRNISKRMERECRRRNSLKIPADYVSNVIEQ